MDRISRPRRNRVTPFGDIEATPHRGTLMGNRGDLLGRDGALRRTWRVKRWIACTLDEIHGRPVPLETPGRYTPLFFCDEAVAFAAGHRPCAECRRPDYRRFLEAWRAANDMPASAPLSAEAIDEALHRARIDRQHGKITCRALLGELPDGTFVTLDDAPAEPLQVSHGKLRGWTHAGYAPPVLASGAIEVTVLTPAPIVGVLKAGYALKT